MHNTLIRPEIIDRVMKRRGRLHWFDKLDPTTTALVVIDMQDTFCAEGAPAEIPVARTIIEPINKLTRRLRPMGVPVIWVLHANVQHGGKSDWEVFFNHQVLGDVRDRMIESLAPGRQRVYTGLEQGNDDLTIFKNRYSALISGASQLERLLRNLGIDTVLIAGTKTDVCCESTARDAMMLDFKVVMLSDCCATLTDDEHNATLETIIQQFGDVLTADEAVVLLER